MAKSKIQNGQAEYGIRHLMEEEMREAEQGVFEPHSSEVGMTKAERKAAASSPQTKMEAAPENKAAPRPISAATARTMTKRRK